MKRKRNPHLYYKCFNAARLLKESKAHNIHRESKEQVKKGKKKKKSQETEEKKHTTLTQNNKVRQMQMRTFIPHPHLTIGTTGGNKMAQIKRHCQNERKKRLNVYAIISFPQATSITMVSYNPSSINFPAHLFFGIFLFIFL